VIGRLSLGARLCIAFALVTVVVLTVAGSVLYGAMARQVESQDDLDIVLTARHLRKLSSEIDSLRGIREHATRLDSLVIGNTAFLMQMRDAQGNVLIEHNPLAVPIPGIDAVGTDSKVDGSAVRSWHDLRGDPIRGVAAQVALRDGSIVDVIVAREMTDRLQLLAHYRATILAVVAFGLVAAVGLGYLLIRVSLAPLREIAQSAARVTVHRLDTRIDVTGVPGELDALVHSFNAMLARLQAGFERLSQFIADLAHDLRTPIANMRGASEVALSRTRSTDEYEALLASNLEECERVSRMIENVLFLARAEHPQFMTNSTTVAVRDELERIAEYFEGIAAEAGVGVHVDGNAQLVADVELFRRAVNNLLANALRHTPRGGVITIVVDERADGVCVTVANPGEPIPPQHLDKLFNRFYRADPSRSNPAGSTGLGLAIVRTIMDLHHGTASVESDARGTRFCLRFPPAAMRGASMSPAQRPPARAGGALPERDAAS
jgi:two-component system heavy metal sensor histidine kinase CusS